MPLLTDLTPGRATVRGGGAVTAAVPAAGQQQRWSECYGGRVGLHGDAPAAVRATMLSGLYIHAGD